MYVRSRFSLRAVRTVTTPAFTALPARTSHHRLPRVTRIAATAYTHTRHHVATRLPHIPACVTYYRVAYTPHRSPPAPHTRVAYTAHLRSIGLFVYVAVASLFVVILIFTTIVVPDVGDYVMPFIVRCRGTHTHTVTLPVRTVRIVPRCVPRFTTILPRFTTLILRDTHVTLTVVPLRFRSFLYVLRRGCDFTVALIRYYDSHFADLRYYGYTFIPSLPRSTITFVWIVGFTLPHHVTRSCACGATRFVGGSRSWVPFVAAAVTFAVYVVPRPLDVRIHLPHPLACVTSHRFPTPATYAIPAGCYLHLYSYCRVRWTYGSSLRCLRLDALRLVLHVSVGYSSVRSGRFTFPCVLLFYFVCYVTLYVAPHTYPTLHLHAHTTPTPHVPTFRLLRSRLRLWTVRTLLHTDGYTAHLPHYHTDSRTPTLRVAFCAVTWDVACTRSTTLHRLQRLLPFSPLTFLPLTLTFGCSRAFLPGFAFTVTMPRIHTRTARAR